MAPLIASFAMGGMRPVFLVIASSLQCDVSLFSSRTPVPNITDIQLAQRDNRNLIGAAQRVPVLKDGPRSCPKTISELFDNRKLLFWNTLPISTLKPKTWREIPAKPLILKDHPGGRGTRIFEISKGVPSRSKAGILLLRTPLRRRSWRRALPIARLPPPPKSL